MRFFDIFVGQGLLEQACQVKLNYFNVFATGFCGGELWEASVVGERSCSSLGGAWRFFKNIQAGGLPRAGNHTNFFAGANFIALRRRRWDLELSYGS